MTTLDDVPALRAQDPGRMLEQVAGLPAQLGRAGEARRGFATPAVPAAGTRSVLVCGMGGSAIGADLAAAWAASLGVRLAVHRDYGLPAGVDDSTFVIFSSYSGNTEETISAFEAAQGKRTAGLACISTGGALAARARAAGVPLFEIPPGMQPRAALGHSLTALLLLLHASGILRQDPLPALESAARHLQEVGRRLAPEVAESDNPAKRLARLVHGYLVGIYTGPGLLQPVGVRWRGQLAENAKTLAFAAAFPELDHNEIMAWSALPELRRRTRLLFLRDRDDGDAIARRMRVTADILESRVAGIEWIETTGTTSLERMLGSVLLGDYTSVYLAFLNGVDPTPVPEIETLKQRLARPV